MKASSGPPSNVPNWTKLGFPTELVCSKVIPGKAETIKVGAYSVQVPVGAFDVPVKFAILSGNPATFQAKAPAGQTPVLAFAFLVRNAQTNQRIGAFKKPVILTATSPHIDAHSEYFNIATNGAYAVNPKGMKLKAGQLVHPIIGAGVGWVITAPATTAATSTKGG